MLGGATSNWAFWAVTGRRVTAIGCCRSGITVTIWHNAARDGEGRLAGMLDGYQPSDPSVRVFVYMSRQHSVFTFWQVPVST
jgi:hypothetical protein